MKKGSPSAVYGGGKLVMTYTQPLLPDNFGDGKRGFSALDICGYLQIPANYIGWRVVDVK